ncbi:hypothetical protein ACIQC9_01155 [Brevundimonas sp. NPDC092305]|uniref:hypothetical protein n=1 Tax=Brevundimonas sp. NPDC092305 TaxID=3363957 RepID=UPI003815CF37
MARFALWKSDLSPPADHFEAAVREVVADFGATWLEDDEDFDLRLRDGTGIEVWFHGDDDGVDIVLAAPHEGALELIHAVADRTCCFTVGDRSSSARSLTSTGGVRPEDHADLTDMDPPVDRRAFIEWMRAEMTGKSPAPQAGGRSKSSPWQRLSDALFGKEM